MSHTRVMHGGCAMVVVQVAIIERSLARYLPVVQRMAAGQVRTQVNWL